MGFKIDALKPESSGSFLEFPLRNLRLAVSFIVAVCAPLIALRYVRTRVTGGPPSHSQGGDKTLPRAWLALKIWAFGLLASVAGGLVIQALMPDTVFVNGLAVFRGVKAVMILPLILAGLVLIGRPGISDLLDRNVTMADLVGVIVLAGAAWIAMERSGNNAGTFPFETGFRSRLEEILWARPRFKEFLIGHPLMIAGIYFSLKSDERPGRLCGIPLATLSIWAGTIGMISVVNSFCHLHTPLSVTAIRTLNGLWLGAILGLLAILVLNLGERVLAGSRRRGRSP